MKRARSQLHRSFLADKLGEAPTKPDGEMRPHATSGWRRRRSHERKAPLDSTASSSWERRGVFAISTLELAEAPDGRGDSIPQWHISLSRCGRERCSDIETKQALACFGLAGAEEDNHHPGIARNFWMPVDPSRRVDCECKETETVVVEPDGYRWSNSDDFCRGCELEVLTGKPCVTHASEAAR